jgi:hypothetical protein
MGMEGEGASEIHTFFLRRGNERIFAPVREQNHARCVKLPREFPPLVMEVLEKAGFW